ncbi:helix-turn-helix domain-containing protein [Streptomyces sp. NPDC005820]|uniref:helix-turn-helix domain-containing protein n=1 Tax=Streptomyces sp. NPDC005820 TaxID=3157069 RepID=UPI0034022092
MVWPGWMVSGPLMLGLAVRTAATEPERVMSGRSADPGLRVRYCWGCEVRARWGCSAAERSARERVRLDAVARFEAGQTSRAIATALRVSERSVERWRPRWRE